MVIWLNPSLTKSSAGYYAGLVASSFMFGRTISSYQWGKWSDVYGRRAVLLHTLAVGTVIQILFGSSTSMTAVLFFRSCLGLFNCIPGLLKTVISESSDDPTWVSDTTGLVFGMWGVGFLIAPLVSGALADPLGQYEGTTFGFLDPVLSRYPFILPNIFGSFCTFVGWLAVKYYFHETLQDAVDFPWIRIWKEFRSRGKGARRGRGRYKRVKSDLALGGDVEDGELREGRGDGGEGEEGYDFDMVKLGGEEGGEEEGGEEEEEKEKRRKVKMSAPPLPPATIGSLLRHPPTLSHLKVYWIFSFCITVTDEIIPLFALCDNRGGLSLEVHKIGLTLSSSGVVYILIQYKMYKFFMNKIGKHGCLILAISVFVPATMLIPGVLFVQGNDEGVVNSKEGEWGGDGDGSTNELTWPAFLYLTILIGVTRAFASMFFSSITLMCNATVHKSHRGTMNGLSMLGGSVAKMLGPLAAGTIFATSVSGFIDERVGSFLAFGVVSIVGFRVALMARNLQLFDAFD